MKKLGVYLLTPIGVGIGLMAVKIFKGDISSLPEFLLICIGYLFIAISTLYLAAKE